MLFATTFGVSIAMSLFLLAEGDHDWLLWLGWSLANLILAFLFL